jgi:hypothetical protein
MRSLKFLTKPFFDYIIYTSGYHKIAYHVVIPLCFTILILYFGTPKSFTSSGYTVLTFISAFSFAALISFSNLDSPFLLEKIWGNKLRSPEVKPVTFQRLKGGHKVKVELTRKAFIALLLGYICFTSTVLLLALVFSDSFNIANVYVRYIGKGIFFWAFFSLLINVIYAIQYFTKINLDQALNNKPD